MERIEKVSNYDFKYILSTPNNMKYINCAKYIGFTLNVVFKSIILTVLYQ